MKTITKIELQKNNPNKVSIFIDELFAFGAFVDDLLDYGIKKGMTLTEEEYNNLVEKLQFRKAKYKALEYLGTGNKTEMQIRKKLCEKEFDENVIALVIDFLEEYRYIDDENFALRYSDYHSKSKRKSIKQIKYELYQKGVDNKYFGNTLEENEKVEQENIQYFLNKYKYNEEIDPVKKNKILNRLLRKGFRYDSIKKIIKNTDESFDI